MMWLAIGALVAVAGCVDNLSSETQEVAGPSGVTVTVRAVDQLAVSWTAVPTANKYYVFQSSGGAPLTFAASILDSSGGQPPTSYIATGLAASVAYCFAVSATFPDGTESDLSAVACAASGGGGPALPPITITYPIPASSARVTTMSPAATLQGATGWLVIGTGELIYPLPVQVGDTITGFRVFGNKQSSSATRLAATVMAVQSSNGVASGSMTASNQAASPGPFTLQPSGAISVQAGFSYIIEADSTTGIQLDIWHDAEVTVSRPRM